MDGTGIQFEGLMRDLGVTPDTIVRWDLARTQATNISGTLNPLAIDGQMSSETRDFEVFDKSHRDRGRAYARANIGEHEGVERIDGCQPVQIARIVISFKTKERRKGIFLVGIGPAG